jgi:hypothetical protein
MIVAPAGAMRVAVILSVFSTTLGARPGSSVETMWSRQRSLQIRYWRACASALAGSHLTLYENDPAKGRAVCRFAPLDDGIRFGIQ